MIGPRQHLKKGVMVLVIICLERGRRGVSGRTELIHNVVSHIEGLTQTQTCVFVFRVRVNDIMVIFFLLKYI